MDAMIVAEAKAHLSEILSRAEAGGAAVWISHWTLAECSGATAFKLRAVQIEKEAATTLLDLFVKRVTSRLTAVDVFRKDFSVAGCKIDLVLQRKGGEELPIHALARAQGIRL